MSASSHHDSNYGDESTTVYPVLGSDPYEAGPVQQAATPVFTGASAIPAGQSRIDDMPIRWGWWAASLGISAVLWAGIGMGVF